MNLKLIRRHALLLFASVSGSASTCFSQGWLDSFRTAQPRVNVGLQNGFPQTNGIPANPYSTNAPPLQPTDPEATNRGFPTGNGYGVGPMLVPNRKDFKLGVYVQNTELGAMITQVAPGSAGQQAGLEPNDIIVAVGGSRLGAFDNRIVELTDELRRNTDNLGRVTLLVLDSRQRILQSIPVSMNSTSSSLAGFVMTRDRMQLPYGSVLTVQLQNASKPFYEILGGKSVTQANGQTASPFELNVDPRYVDPRDQYQLIAYISSGNQELYRLPQPIAINMNALGQPINLTLERSQGGFVNSNPIPSGNVVNVGYPAQIGTNDIANLYANLLGRAPSARESIAWQSYLQSGNSINDVAAKLLSSPQFRERFQNEASYLQQAILLATKRQPNQQELSFWLTRLQSNSPEVVIGEILQKNQ
jgi:uncharacterized lipoprotein YbaY